MKKFITLFLALALCFGMAACGAKDSPSDALKADIEAAKDSPEELMGELDDTYSEEAGQKLIDKMLDFDYELGEEKIDGDTATVEVTVTTYPFGEIMSQVIADYITEAFANINMTEEEASDMMSDIMIEALDSAEKTYESTVTTNLTKVDGEWVVEESQEFADALTGGIYELADSLQ